MAGKIARSALISIAAVAGAGVALRRHGRIATGREVAGGILIGDVRSYDRLSRLLNPLFRGIAEDVARAAAPEARVLEVGCGPGWLAIRMARSHGLVVTGLDLDPAMIERATANAGGSPASGQPPPSFVVGDVAALPFGDEAFDIVVSTFSMHHWSDAGAGLTEIARVLRPGGRALIWDLRPGRFPLHGHRHEPTLDAAAAGLRVASTGPWRWPWRVRLAQRIELVRD